MCTTRTRATSSCTREACLPRRPGPEQATSSSAFPTRRSSSGRRWKSEEKRRQSRQPAGEFSDYTLAAEDRISNWPANHPRAPESDERHNHKQRGVKRFTLASVLALNVPAEEVPPTERKAATA